MTDRDEFGFFPMDFFLRRSSRRVGPELAAETTARIPG